MQVVVASIGTPTQRGETATASLPQLGSTQEKASGVPMKSDHCPFVARACLTLAVAIAGPRLVAQHDVLTSRFDNARTGAALTETLLTPEAIDANRDASQFGKLFSYDLSFGDTLGGDVYAQPLYISRVGIPGHGTKNLLLVATMNGFVFAYDADGPNAAVEDGVMWKRNLGPPPSVDDVWRFSTFSDSIVRGDNIRGNLGIMSTPTVDRDRGIVFVVARVLLDRDHIAYQLHALDLREGFDLTGSPTTISGSALGVQFEPNYQNQRPGLALTRGQVIIAFGSYADVLPYHGWVFSYRYDTNSGFLQTASFVTTPDGDTSYQCAIWRAGVDAANSCAHGGIWMSGRAPAVDPSGRVLVMVGNGINDMGASPPRNFGNSLLALDPITLSVLDFFTPENHLFLNMADLDLGGSGPMVIPESNLVVGGGKQGVMYVWRLDNLGKFVAGDPSLIQHFDAGTVTGGNLDTGNDMPGGALVGGVYIDERAGHIMGGPVFWPRTPNSGGSRLFEWSENSNLFEYAVDPAAAQPVTVPPVAIGPDTQIGHPGGILTLSADRTVSGTGIVWAAGYHTDNPCDLAPKENRNGALNRVCPGILRAYDAEDLRLLWTSDINEDRDGHFIFAKFNPPTVASGRVYLATFSNRIIVYGLLHHNYVRPAAWIAAVTATPMVDDGD